MKYMSPLPKRITKSYKERYASVVQDCIHAILVQPPKKCSRGEFATILYKHPRRSKPPAGWPRARVVAKNDEWTVRRYNAERLLDMFYEIGMAPYDCRTLFEMRKSNFTELQNMEWELDATNDLTKSLNAL